MTGEPATTTYSVPEPFEVALKLIRDALARAGLVVQGDLDVARRIQRSLGINMARSNVLFVCSKRSLEAINIRPEVGILLPLHIVVSARGGQTEIHLLASLPSNSDNPAPALVASVNGLQNEISRAIEKIAMLRGYCHLETGAGQIDLMSKREP